MVLTNEFHNDPTKRTLLVPNRFGITVSDCDHLVWWDRDGNEKTNDVRLNCASENILSQFPSGHRFLVLCRMQIFRVSSKYERVFSSIFELEHRRALDI